MNLEREFPLECSRQEIVDALRSDEVLANIFPDTRIQAGADGTRETFTRDNALGQQKELHMIFHTEDSGDLCFEKVCDGSVWRSLDGRIELEALEYQVTNVRIAMKGRTRPLVPELTIRGPMESQLDQMADSLQKQPRGRIA